MVDRLWAMLAETRRKSCPAGVDDADCLNGFRLMPDRLPDVGAGAGGEQSKRLRPLDCIEAHQAISCSTRL
jgi:hypothetical protein